MSRPFRVVICGYYGFENLGDEAILDVLLQRIRAEQANAEIVVLAGSVDNIRRDHQVSAIHWQDIERIRAAVFSADHVIVGGGGLFEDLFMTPPTSLLTATHGGLTYYGGIALLAQAAGVRTTIESIGVGPLRDEASRELAGAILAGSNAIRVRDPSSANLVAEIAPAVAAEVVLDPAWSLQPSPRLVGAEIIRGEALAEISGIDDPARRPLAVSVRHWQGFRPTELVRALRAITDRDPRPILFIPFSRGPRPAESDFRASLELVAALPNAAVLGGRYTAAEIASVLGECELTIAMRLHASILSLRAGTPAVGLAYHPKVAELFGVNNGYRSVTLEATAEEIAAAVATTLGQVPSGPFRDEIAPTVGLSGHQQRDRRGVEMLLSAMSERADATESEVAAVRNERQRAVADATDSANRSHSAARRAETERDTATARLATLEAGRGMRMLRALWKVRRSLSKAVDGWSDRGSAGDRDTGAEPSGSSPRSDSDGACDLPDQTATEADVWPGLLQTLRMKIGSRTNEIVVLAPSIAWDAVLFQRPQQLALAIGRLGFPVLYCATSDDPEVRSVAPNVQVVAAPDGGKAIVSQLEPMAVLALPYNYAWTSGLDSAVRLLDHIDDLDVFDSFDAQDLRSWFDVALRDADIVACTAESLRDEVLPLRPDAVLCPNGVDVSHFAPDLARGVPEDFPGTHEGDLLTVGFFGAMARWVDWDLISEVATRLEGEAEFVFIGPDYDRSMWSSSRLWEAPNVAWLGPRDHRDLPAYLDQFDVAIVPFLVNKVTNAVSPVKLFEYFAGECPVVATPVREIVKFPEVHTASDPEAFSDAIRAAGRTRRQPEAADRLRRRALTNSWDVRATLVMRSCLQSRSTLAQAALPG